MIRSIVILTLLTLSQNDISSAQAHKQQNLPSPEQDAIFEKAYKAFEKADKDTTSRVTSINEGLKDNQHYNNCQDIGNTDNLVRSILAGLYLRKSVLKLGFDEIESVVTANDEFFKTRLGVSLIYGWTLSQYQQHITPYYIGKFFSFKDHFAGLADKTKLEQDKKDFLNQRFDLGWKAVEADRWAFYFDHMLWLHSAIDRVREDQENHRQKILKNITTEIDTELKANNDNVTKDIQNNVKTVSPSPKTLSSYRNIEQQAIEANQLNQPELPFVKQTSDQGFPIEKVVPVNIIKIEQDVSDDSDRTSINTSIQTPDTSEDSKDGEDDSSSNNDIISDSAVNDHTSGENSSQEGKLPYGENRKESQATEQGSNEKITTPVKTKTISRFNSSFYSPSKQTSEFLTAGNEALTQLNNDNHEISIDIDEIYTQYQSEKNKSDDEKALMIDILIKYAQINITDSESESKKSIIDSLSAAKQKISKRSQSFFSKKLNTNTIIDSCYADIKNSLAVSSK